MSKSAFLEWFESQHGTRHEAGDYDTRTDAELEEAMMQGEAARMIWTQRQQWDARRQSALYAWCARDSTPNASLLLTWHKCKDRMPAAEDEVLVWIDGHRGPAWRNNHALVAYCDTKGDWWEERHPSRSPLVGVIAWAHIDEPDA